MVLSASASGSLNYIALNLDHLRSHFEVLLQILRQARAQYSIKMSTTKKKNECYLLLGFVQTPYTFIFQTWYRLPNIEGKVLWWITWKERPHHEINPNCISVLYSQHQPTIIFFVNSVGRKIRVRLSATSLAGVCACGMEIKINTAIAHDLSQVQNYISSTNCGFHIKINMTLINEKQVTILNQQLIFKRMESISWTEVNFCCEPLSTMIWFRLIEYVFTFKRASLLLTSEQE